MQGFVISLNEKHLVSISMDDLQVFSFQVHGDVLGEEFSQIYISGGNYEGGNEKYLIWADSLEINGGDEIRVRFLDNVSTSHSGKTIDELHSTDPLPEGPNQPLEAVFTDLGSRPKLRNKFEFKVTPPSGQELASQSEPNDFSYGFSVLWNWKNPSIAKVSLTSNSLEKIKNRENGFVHTRFKLDFGQEVAFRAIA